MLMLCSEAMCCFRLERGAALQTSMLLTRPGYGNGLRHVSTILERRRASRILPEDRLSPLGASSQQPRHSSTVIMQHARPQVISSNLHFSPIKTSTAARSPRSGKSAPSS